MQVVVNEVYKVELTKREFTLITKALVGKLSDKPINLDFSATQAEIEEARELGLELMGRAQMRVAEKLDALTHARNLASGRNGGDGVRSEADHE